LIALPPPETMYLADISLTFCNLAGFAFVMIRSLSQTKPEKSRALSAQVLA
jgi:hypothetical protein